VLRTYPLARKRLSESEVRTVACGRLVICDEPVSKVDLPLEQTLPPTTANLSNRQDLDGFRGYGVVILTQHFASPQGDASLATCRAEERSCRARCLAIRFLRVPMWGHKLPTFSDFGMPADRLTDHILRKQSKHRDWKDEVRA
jgi:hypothetical protein